MKRFMSLCTAMTLILGLLLTGCGSEGTQTADTDVQNTSEQAAESTTSDDSAQTQGEDSQTADTVSADVWVMEEAPAVRNSLSEEEKAEKQQAILDKGLFLFSGDTNKGYYPSDWADWLCSADSGDILAIVFACDDPTHGGWGVLGLSVQANGLTVQEDIPAFSDEPEKERLYTYSISTLMDMVGISSPSEFSNFSLGAWNGGRIAGLYYLAADVADELTDFLAEVEDTEALIHTYDGYLSNENAIENAVTVYDYIKSVYGTNCLTGQMESTWMGSPDYEMDYIEDASGRLPAIRGLDFMHNDFEGVVERSIDWWEDGGIVTICWHTGADFASGYNESLADDINWDEAFVPGSETYNALLEGMDRAVPYLQQLEDAGVPVLWRPFHELDGGWFWWSKGGSDNFVKLWQLMYSRYTDYWGLDNLIWVYGYSQNGNAMDTWYPGDDYVDILGADSYRDGANDELYLKVLKIAPEGMPIVFHECGQIPTEAELAEHDTDWAFFMTWHTNYITEENTKEAINEIYNGEYFITLDELPAFK